ncbi:heat-shock protein Hsp20 [Pseudidiomarina marina]|uniref:Heat-shock protein Hsp20 n=2 Tax=Pseudidiomarina marina TaxID=502366 RepID=A0A432YIR2_9GAMM|nr:heat-shock protein Hsp20 [Pseudidiomarina marina]
MMPFKLEVIIMNDSNLSRLAPWNWFKHESDKPQQGNRSSSLTPFSRFHDEMDRLLNDTFKTFTVPRLFDEHNADFWKNTDVIFRPKVDISESPEQYSISVELPGVEKKDLKLSVEGNYLTIQGEKRSEETRKNDNYHTIERRYGHFQRVLNLPDDVKADSVSATFKNGVLHISIGRDKSKSTSDQREIPIS